MAEIKRDQAVDEEIVISISRNGLLKSCARFVIQRSEIRKKQHDFKSVHFECRMAPFLHDMEEKSTLVDFFPLYWCNVNQYLKLELLDINKKIQNVH